MSLPVGVILAGGQARRMGMGKADLDKGLLGLCGQSLLGRVIDRISTQVEQLALNANGDASRFDGLELPVIQDQIKGFVGPLAGVLAGMDWAASNGHSHIVTVAADTPFFPRDLVKNFLAVAEQEKMPIVLAGTIDPERGMLRHPTFGLWSVDLREDLRGALKGGMRKMTQWADDVGAAIAPFDVLGYDPFFNVNNFADLDEAKRIIEAEKI